jgi:hypothetical protein
MEIINQTEQEFILKTPEQEIRKIKKIGFFTIFFSLFLLIVSIYKSGNNELKCERIAESLISCELKRSQLMGFYLSENIEINPVNTVILEDEKVFIVTENENIYWSPYKNHQVRLNNWINNPLGNSQLTLSYGSIFSQIILIIILSIFLLSGLQMFKNKGRSITFKKNDKRFTYIYKNLGFKQTFESPFEDIKRVEHKFVSSIDGSKYYVVNLVLNTKNMINLSQCILLHSSKEESLSLNLANNLKTFLGLWEIN